MNLKDNILKYGSFLLVFLSPLIFWSHGLYPHISSKTFFIYGLVEILFFVWIYSIILDKSYRLPKKIFLWFLPVMFYILWMSIAGIFAVNPGLAFWSSFGRGTGLLTLYHLLALSFIISSLVRRNGLTYIYSLFKTIVFGSFFLSLSVWLGTEGFNLSFIRVLKTDAGGGFGGNSTLTAGYLLFTLAISFFLLNIKNLDFKNKLFIWFTIFVTIFSPLFINIYGFFVGKGIFGIARGTLLALFTGAIVVGLSYMFLSNKKWIRNTSIVILFSGIISFGFLWNQLITPNTYIHQKFIEQARDTRFIFWDIASIAMDKHPFLGYGPENYFMAFQENFNPQVLLAENSYEGWVDRAHNIYYDTGISGGYPAIFFYIIFLFSLVYGLYHLSKKEKLSRIQLSIICGLIIAHIANHLFTFESNLSLLATFIFAGIIYSLNQENYLKDKELFINISEYNKRAIIFIFFVLFSVSGIVFVFMPTIKSARYAEIFSSSVDKRPLLYPELLKGSVVGSHWDVSYLAFSIYKAYSLNPAQLKSDKAKLSYLIKELEALIAYLNEVSKNNKTDYRLYITMAYLENMLTYMSDRPYSNELRDKVLNYLEKAKSLSPTNPNIYWVMAQTKIWGGDFVGTEQAYRDAISVAPLLPASYDLFLNYAKIIGNQGIYNEVANQAKIKIPNYKLK